MFKSIWDIGEDSADVKKDISSINQHIFRLLNLFGTLQILLPISSPHDPEIQKVPRQ